MLAFDARTSELKQMEDRGEPILTDVLVRLFGGPEAGEDGQNEITSFSCKNPVNGDQDVAVLLKTGAQDAVVQTTTEKFTAKFPEAAWASGDEVPDESKWQNGDSCFMCKTAFTYSFLGYGTPRHHCRACSRSVCAACSSHEVRLPHMGYNDPVRVCDECVKREVESNLSEMTPESILVRAEAFATDTAKYGPVIQDIHAGSLLHEKVLRWMTDEMIELSSVVREIKATVEHDEERVQRIKQQSKEHRDIDLGTSSISNTMASVMVVQYRSPKLIRLHEHLDELLARDGAVLSRMLPIHEAAADALQQSRKASDMLVDSNQALAAQTRGRSSDPAMDIAASGAEVNKVAEHISRDAMTDPASPANGHALSALANEQKRLRTTIRNALTKADALQMTVNEVMPVVLSSLRQLRSVRDDLQNHSKAVAGMLEAFSQWQQNRGMILNEAHGHEVEMQGNMQKKLNETVQKLTAENASLKAQLDSKGDEQPALPEGDIHALEDKIRQLEAQLAVQTEFATQRVGELQQALSVANEANKDLVTGTDAINAETAALREHLRILDADGHGMNQALQRAQGELADMNEVAIRYREALIEVGAKAGLTNLDGCNPQALCEAVLGSDAHSIRTHEPTPVVSLAGGGGGIAEDGGSIAGGGGGLAPPVTSVPEVDHQLSPVEQLRGMGFDASDARLAEILRDAGGDVALATTMLISAAHGM